MKKNTLSAILFMTLFFLVSCNNGSVDEENPQSKFLKSVVSLSNDFLNVFTSFGEMVGSVLRFNTNTKKSDVKDYFKKVQNTVQGTKKSLEKIVSDMKSEGNPNAESVETEVKKLIDSVLNKIIDGAKGASDAIGDSDALLGNAAAAGAAGAGGVKGDNVDSLVNGIKLIVDVVLQGKGNPDAGDGIQADTGAQRGQNAGEAGKLFGTDAGGAAANAKKAVGDATKAVGAVTGADILKAITKGVGGDAAKLAKHNGVANNITASGVAQNAKDAVIAGGIALRAMAKNGKFANGNNVNNDVKDGIKNAAVSAVTKALDTLTIAIRKTIDEGLRTVKDAMQIDPDAAPVTTAETKK
ncbi:variable large family protein (plasmid) [Borrelia coriaceae]|uniref:Variable large protein n=1 Tax=Borrelia coriaceae ATCC 43381 TaxID=1408429 RepID=W5T1Y8_9SPIR|nr:variable large family protein [Borrelia coriaceae]AHH11306.1 Variable outer membrane protein [Borrelia coriaceae ATCC 43381]UPA17393.1 variable large family protein [Borrelia coriaceae]